MEHYKVFLSHEAQADIRSAVRYVAVNLQEPSTAEHLLDSFSDAISSLKTTPERFALVADIDLAALGLRMLTVGNYLIFYVVNRGELRVDIPRVLYGKRNWMQLLKKDIK